MATISLNTSLYNEAQHYAHRQNMSVEEWVSSLILKFLPKKKEKYKMKALDELSPELQQLIGFAKPAIEYDDINGDKARMEYLTEKFEQ
jgi:hypothetical protein